MPAAKYSLQFDTGKFFDGAGAPVLTFVVKNKSIKDIELAITQNNVAMSFPAGTSVKAALKKTTAAAGVLLLEDDAVRSGWGAGSRWFFRLDLTGAAFDAVAGNTLDFEILIELPDGQRIRSLTIPFTIAT